MTVRFDLLFVPPGGGYALSDAAPRAILGGLASHRLILPFEECVGADEVEVYCKVNDASHNLLGPGEAPKEPAFLELVLRFGTPKAPPFGVESPAHFWIEIRGCLKAQIDGKHRQRLTDLTGARLQFFQREHTAIVPRPDFAPRTEKAEVEAEVVAPIGCRVEDL